MKKAVLSLALASGLALLVPTTACNNGGDCEFKSKCGNDAPMTPDQITACNNRKSSACGDKYSDYLGCFQDHQTCTTSGITDETITNGTCGVQYQAWIHCCTGIEGGVADGGFPQCGF